MNPRMMQALTLTLLFLTVLSSTAYTIRETQRGVLIQFGEIIDADLKPGLGFKLPFMHEIRKFDARTQVTDSERTEYLTQENKFLIVDSYVLWKVADVKKYFTVTSGDSAKAEILLLARVKDSLKNKVSERTVHEVVAGEQKQQIANLLANKDQEYQTRISRLKTEHLLSLDQRLEEEASRYLLSLKSLNAEIVDKKKAPPRDRKSVV